MRSRLVLTCCAFALIAAISSGSVRVATGESPRVASDGDPHRVTVRHLREALANSGLTIRPARTPSPSASTITGVASVDDVKIGFEFQIFSSSDVATIRRLGRLRPTDFGWPPARFDPLYRTWIRGVLGNVAYAQYEVETDQQLLAERARRRVIRELDDVLFGLFPSGDPYANALIPAGEH
jgi:hypothetical protein